MKPAYNIRGRRILGLSAATAILACSTVQETPRAITECETWCKVYRADTSCQDLVATLDDSCTAYCEKMQANATANKCTSEFEALHACYFELSKNTSDDFCFQLIEGKSCASETSAWNVCTGEE